MFTIRRLCFALSTFTRGTAIIPVLLLTGSALIHCTSDEIDDTTAEPTVEDTATLSPTPSPVPAMGTLAVRFRIEEDWLGSMDENPVGTFYGAIYSGDDVSSTGPSDGAASLEDIELNLDLPTDDEPTDVLFTTQELPVGEVYILGFLDSDANATEEDIFPDSGDPVTVPGDNDFDVVADTETEVVVLFDMVLTGNEFKQGAPIALRGRLVQLENTP